MTGGHRSFVLKRGSTHYFLGNGMPFSIIKMYVRIYTLYTLNSRIIENANNLLTTSLS